MTTPAASRSPRLLVKVLCSAFAVIGCVIMAVFVLFSWETNARLTRAVVENMESSQLRFAGINARLRREHTLQAMALAENPTLKAAVDTYYSERANEHELGQLKSTIETELAKLQTIMAVPALSVTDVGGVVLASAGPNREIGRLERESNCAWPRHATSIDRYRQPAEAASSTRSPQRSMSFEQPYRWQRPSLRRPTSASSEPSPQRSMRETHTPQVTHSESRICPSR
ncbi:MAG TPA: hypothetical protein VFB99_17195, partial [Vicinamibacterales bacterium]|nr:hypothetical protein [Vicinamibacterales bacterium]